MKRPGVSPLIAAVLLIAFTMAVAAILTAWISSFTQSQKEKSAEFEQKVQCAFADIQADTNFVRYNTNTGIFSVWLENTGSEKVLIKYLTVDYGGGNITRKMQLNSSDTLSLEKEEGGTFGPLNITAYAADTAKSGIVLTGGEVPQKIILMTTCEGVKTTLFRPTTGWVP